MGASFAAALMLRREREVVAAFRAADATSAATARSLDELHLADTRAVRRLIARAVLREPTPHAYYLDEPSWEALGRQRRRVVFAVLAIALLFALLVLSTA